MRASIGYKILQEVFKARKHFSYNVLLAMVANYFTHDFDVQADEFCADILVTKCHQVLGERLPPEVTSSLSHEKHVIKLLSSYECFSSL